MLAALVASGDLPEVEDRLPVADDIQIVVPVDTVGEYGGTWYYVTWGDDPSNFRMVTNRQLTLQLGKISLTNL